MGKITKIKWNAKASMDDWGLQRKEVEGIGNDSIVRIGDSGFKNLSISDIYSIDREGRIKNNKRNTFVKHSVNKYGYITVNLWINRKKKTASIHRLLAEAFIPNPENKRCVNHINGIKGDFRLENLEWVTYSENQTHSYKNGLSKRPIGVRNPFNKWSEEQVFKVKKLLKTTNYTHQKIADIVEVTKYLVDDISCGKRWKHL